MRTTFSTPFSKLCQNAAFEGSALMSQFPFRSTVVTTAFFISVCYHTPYAVPWVIPPVAFYTFDFLVRLIRMRFKDAYLEAPDNLITLVSLAFLLYSLAPPPPIYRFYLY